MIEEAIYKLKVNAPMILPDLFDNFWLGEIKAYEDYAIVPYTVHNPIPMDKVVNLLDEANLAILYHIVPDRKKVQTDFGQKCCAYFYPSLEQMYKLNCQTDTDGLVRHIDVTVYDSLEDMVVEVRKDLHKNEERGAVFLTRRLDAQIMNDFSVHR